MKRPAFQFYPADWRKDAEVQACSLTARGLWLEMLCIMHECEPYGHLTINGRPMQPDQLARLVGLGARECRKLLKELEENGVFSRTQDGAVFSRRMVRDDEVRAARAAGGESGKEYGVLGASYGRQGGRPRKNKGGSETPDPGAGKGGAETPLGAVEKPAPSSSPSSSPSPSGAHSSQGSSEPRERFDRIEAVLRGALGAQNDPNPMLCDISPIVALIDAGVSLEGIIVPKIKVMAANGRADSLRRKGRPWSYIATAVRDDLAGDQQRASGLKNGNGHGPPPVEDDEAFAKYLRWGRTRRVWCRSEWGPAPGEPGCRVPASMLQPGDGEGWAEYQGDGR